MKPLLGAQGALLRNISAIIAADARLRAAFGADRRQLPPMIVESATSSDWASATFAGQHHRLKFRLGCYGLIQAAGMALLQKRLDEVEIEISGHIVAEIAIVGIETERDDDGATSMLVVIEALTIVD